MLASVLKRDLKNLIQRDASPNFQAQNGLLSLRSWWRSVRSLQIPLEIRAHVIGPRLAAVMSYFSGRHHLGRRAVEEVVETVFEVPTSLGSISALEAETSAALAGPYQEAQTAVREASVKNTDETGWSEKGQKRWLWTAATATVAFFVIHLRRNFQG